MVASKNCPPLSLDLLTVKPETKVRDAFYASDFKKPSFDLYHSFIGTAKTNPIKWNDTLRMGAGNGVEDALLKVLKDSGFVEENYDQTEHGRVNFTRKNIEIHGRIDALTKDGIPVEIKSINNKNNWDISAYRDGYPRENYVGQLAVYMDYLGKDIGYLFVASVDGQETFIFECKRDGDWFTCGSTRINLETEYARWDDLYTNHIQNKVEPDIFEFRYKIPVDEIDWTKMSKAKITSARNNRAVIGDFQVQYSPYKNMWVKKQKVELGYTAEELEKIMELTKGYSNW